MAKKTLFEMKQDLVTIGAQLEKVENEIADKAIDPKVTTDELNQLTQTKADLKTRFDLLKAQHDSMEAEQKEALAAKQQANSNILDGVDDEKTKTIKAKASFIKAVMTKNSIPDDVRNALSMNNIKAVLGADSTLQNGDKLLPITISTELLTEPMATNPLRGNSTFTQITNLEIPKLSFTLSDDGFLPDDSQTAKELEADGDVVTFGRNKFKVFCDITETVLNGTETNLVATVQAGLQSGLAAKEKKVAFESAKPTDMSFYQKDDKGNYLIKTVSGNTLFNAIIAALADLEDGYSENAKVVMKKSDYFNMLKELANNNTSLFLAPPEQILGAPVIFCDLATIPVVGDLRYSHYNYDLKMLYDQDKNVKTGIESFVLTAWIDHKIKLKSAFRLAVVTP
ncbi:HK97 family phage major capsid protein [Clostridium acetobutylicum]|uniref:Phage capsid-like C-terminal domain-containing protein n=1 Tax=Clostridium acetobutylicum (strain ATCC 824 / DSM 792 / JCM 1419 / IAM 19013 / LMG 5710 / NBRC 13948 / NRRL B-527 / VKM B-1787 / 2291 / W) TaxID=272562 RepID=Q97HW5_CLOAB|nr:MULTISPECIES: phage major capsid protein [Clostridium]AAK79855.1 Hypothetical protein CA_C1892 [Clostridium acetobutylicum ATCC 824]ADZ20941.1 Conserved hypothetical protein [Clostridium acetobutylicum EA 2018]AEI32031.1 hypothetical protein SMB_G1917 [Clostridium acetobutylicum DSM 1731]AWV79715.1 phage major capsid protein [Clostridium acetobutylicum]MBC2394307.1 phage major capsid protein [Clostridium acetobutylicum]